MDGNGRMTKEIRLQWGETPASVGKCCVNVHVRVFAAHVLELLKMLIV